MAEQAARMDAGEEKAGYAARSAKAICRRWEKRCICDLPV